MNKEEFKGLMKFLSAIYRVPLEKATIDAYAILLGQYEIEDAMGGVKNLVSTNVYPTFPTPGAIINEIEAYLDRGLLDAGGAYELAMKLVREYGHGTHGWEKASELMPPEVEDTCKILGWDAICLSTEPEIARAQFLKMYETVKLRARKGRTNQASVPALTEIAQKMSLEGRKDSGD